MEQAADERTLDRYRYVLERDVGLTERADMRPRCLIALVVLALATAGCSDEADEAFDPADALASCRSDSDMHLDGSSDMRGDQTAEAAASGYAEQGRLEPVTVADAEAEFASLDSNGRVLALIHVFRLPDNRGWVVNSMTTCADPD